MPSSDQPLAFESTLDGRQSVDQKRSDAEAPSGLDVGARVVKEPQGVGIDSDPGHDRLKRRRVGLDLAQQVRREGDVEAVEEGAEAVSMKCVTVGKTADRVALTQASKQRLCAGVGPPHGGGGYSDELLGREGDLPFTKEGCCEVAWRDPTELERPHGWGAQPARSQNVVRQVGGEHRVEVVERGCLVEHAAKIEEEVWVVFAWPCLTMILLS